MCVKNKTLGLTIGMLAAASTSLAAEVPITGNVTAKCSIFTDVSGVYGQPTPNKLSTSANNGGVQPIIRYDVASADYYTAKITYPTSFSTSPSLSDSVTWTGDVEVSSTSDTNMAGYEAAKVQYDAVTEFDLTVAGTTWFKVSSEATYGYDKSLPAGDYTALVEALCVAN
tara:strand:- start:11509 stop:12018 length:510 start_codon:yes stop_codon:yes gene_type:complete